MAFKPGKSGNPTGRPQQFRDDLRKLIGERGEKAFAIIWDVAQGKRNSKKWMSQEGGPVEVDALPSIKEQCDAAQVLIEHLVGKPVQAMEHDATQGLLTAIININQGTTKHAK